MDRMSEEEVYESGVRGMGMEGLRPRVDAVVQASRQVDFSSTLAFGILLQRYWGCVGMCILAFSRCPTQGCDDVGSICSSGVDTTSSAGSGCC